MLKMSLERGSVCGKRSADLHESPAQGERAELGGGRMKRFPQGCVHRCQDLLVQAFQNESDAEHHCRAQLPAFPRHQRPPACGHCFKFTERSEISLSPSRGPCFDCCMMTQASEGWVETMLISKAPPGAVCKALPL